MTALMTNYLTIATFIDHVSWYTVKVFRVRISKLLSCPCFKFNLSNLNVWMSYIAQLVKLSQEFCCYIKTFFTVNGLYLWKVFIVVESGVVLVQPFCS